MSVTETNRTVSYNLRGSYYNTQVCILTIVHTPLLAPCTPKVI